MYRILIVDDEPFILDGLRNIINWEEYGIEIYATALDGVTALEIIRNTKIDILLTDIKMHEMNGLELIKKAKEIEQNIKYIILSGFDDFELVKEALKLGVENYILKPVSKEELSSTLLSTIEKIESRQYNKIHLGDEINIIRENTLYRWISNNINPRELRERASLIGIDLMQKEYMIALIKIIDNSMLENSDLIDGTVYNVLKKVIGHHNNTIMFYDLNGDIVLLFSGENISSVKTQILALLQKSINTINSSLKIDVFITLGTIETGYQAAHKSYFTAKDLQDYSLVFPANNIVDIENIITMTSKKRNTLDINLQKLNRLLNSRNRKETLEYIDYIFNMVSSSKELFSPSDIQNIAIEILYNIFKVIRKTNKSVKFNINQMSFVDVLKIKDIDSLANTLKLIINETFDYLTLQDENISPIIRRVLLYVDNRYHEDISIKTLSCLFNINPSYLGQLFKNETGELFTNYLNKIRIEKAKSMLENTHYKVNEIAQKIGYTNQSYFFRVFKRLTGVSPSEYKKNQA